MTPPILFWDASALVPLMVEEGRSMEARDLWTQTTEAYAWEWVLVEVEASLIRRKACQETWQDWRQLLKKLRLFSLQTEDLGKLRFLNRGMGLRAADAGHLFMFHGLVHSFFNLELLSFDHEMVTAAQQLGLPGMALT
ncbi:MAG: type II toxin-antitoxin system VapC family toxin [Verrucomicrobia bacterium]|nr:type II toxin-antitoxin system VapC family toxin [Verrucomicrobiota bacterium]MCH8513914.1 type II toxin-antitoxin system VapC family toxin [Kiritimatiellia bacterium]